PGDHCLRTVLGVDQDHVPDSDATCVQASSDLLGISRELGVGPTAVRSITGFPDQEGVVAAVLATVIEHPGDVLATELIGRRHGRIVSRLLVRRLPAHVSPGIFDRSSLRSRVSRALKICQISSLSEFLDIPRLSAGSRGAWSRTTTA